MSRYDCHGRLIFGQAEQAHVHQRIQEHNERAAAMESPKEEEQKQQKPAPKAPATPSKPQTQKAAETKPEKPKPAASKPKADEGEQKPAVQTSTPPLSDEDLAALDLVEAHKQAHTAPK